MTKKRIMTVIIVCAAIILTALVIWTAWGNSALKLNTVMVESKNLPVEFSGFRIAHVSDLHNTEIGNNNAKLLTMIESSKPDIIAITGDIIDSRNTSVDVALDFVKEAVEIAPCYYVTGNHESRVDDAFARLEKGLEELGVTVLRNKKTTLEKDGASISVVGVDDPTFAFDTDEMLESLTSEEDLFTLLLSHRPELFDVYAENGIDLTLSGHAHGGQFRLPFVGGIIAPNQGIFPKYDAGLYTAGDTNMVVSRGIGNSIFPFRFNNRPEVVLIELEKEEK
ncbi:MAG: metallophosphoesterase [Clostridia bacterium]|nr:metallophosphoesterase [Clostridia bacterium]